MRMTRLLARTLRETPKEAEVVSHQLLVRGGYIRQVASGIYNLLPLMWRVVQKINTIVRDELDTAGCQELLMPILQPADLWKESGRWDVYGKELVRLKDRHDRECVLAPTHEEVITDIARKELTSYRLLPQNLYQIQLKYRDEQRPRFGLLRGREFMMKDAYSFHASNACLDDEYERMATAYTNIFNRCGLETVMVRSDSGAIGGSESHEFMVLTHIAEGEQESGENVVFYCDSCDYAANAERAESQAKPATLNGPEGTSELIATPNATSIEALHKDFGFEPSLILKSLVYVVDEEKPVLALICGHMDVEETKLKNALAANTIRMATADEITAWTGSSKGFIGPINLPANITVVADANTEALTNFYVAENEPGLHRIKANWGTDVPKPSTFLDIRLVQVGDGCPSCESGALKETRGIEVGNIFKLGTKYSESLSATYTAEDGTEQPFIMGCYGIGITRTAAAAIECFHDKDGMLWPMAIAPYHAMIIPVNPSDEAQMALATQVYERLKPLNIEAVLDDRDERAGVKFKDADLMGFPIRITAGKKAAEGLLECKMRGDTTAQDLTLEQALAWAQEQFKTWTPRVTPTPELVAAK
ncbi:MAG: proline--tRNA ligase [Vampirovibrionales bacterium]|nr:proline--tRNA ligase [Vampirovibrionales bacterium]